MQPPQICRGMMRKAQLRLPNVAERQGPPQTSTALQWRKSKRWEQTFRLRQHCTAPLHGTHCAPAERAPAAAGIPTTSSCSTCTSGHLTTDEHTTKPSFSANHSLIFLFIQCIQPLTKCYSKKQVWCYGRLPPAKAISSETENKSWAALSAVQQCLLSIWASEIEPHWWILSVSAAKEVKRRTNFRWKLPLQSCFALLLPLPPPHFGMPMWFSFRVT